MIYENKFPESTLKTLDSFFADGRTPHAILIDGGSEKDRIELALLAARMLVCENKDRVPCGECEHCRKASENIHPDIIRITKPDDKKLFVKADVKKMVAEAYLTPNEANVKVYVISEMQLMNEESQNLLLKILEEPPSYTAFILTSVTSNAVIGTVLSRVIRLRLGEIVQAECSEKAKDVIKKLSQAVITPYEYDRIEATAPLDGNKALTVEMLNVFCDVLRDSIALKNGGKALYKEFFEESRIMSERLSLKKLLDMYNYVDELIKSLENNPNYTLLCTVLCAGI